ncbi:fumarylacetoacetate hydrolase family protein [Paenibacillus sp. VCA1]|uniref:fumarylacetoacetate hydrolase family protein n=1 Tax=Paenibacillus sp. VCA1 TaxID=3039148 RepID=UPI002871D798|nr:fumarylacetoacetate hydrolase family protein [Paenibacillus sp. VCA1]MDR9857419.1 fumarylacetoacetate hydrolase family protein [Paenibacillus sp. VCA1]
MIQNVYCVGRNYRLHAAELGNDVPDEPMIFLKPSHAVARLAGQTLELPQNKGEVHYEGELVLRVRRSYEPGIKVDDLVGQMALGIDFTLRDVQTGIKKKGHPWTAAKGFKNAAPISEFIDFPGVEAAEGEDFTVRQNGKEVQRGNIKEMIFPLQEIVDYIGANYGLGEGDVIFTGTPAGVGPCAAGDTFELYWGDRLLGSCVIG